MASIITQGLGGSSFLLQGLVPSSTQSSSNSSFSQEFSFNVGNTPLYWYRVEGECIDPSCGNASMTTGCSANQMIQIIAARSVPDLCTKLTTGGYVQPTNWPIKSIARFTRPVSRTDIAALQADGQDMTCNQLVPEPFANIPECFDLALAAQPIVQAGIQVILYLNNFNGNATINFGGAAVVSSSAYSYVGNATIEFFAGNGLVQEGTFIAKGGIAASLQELAVAFETDTSSITPLPVTADTINTNCSCKALPSTVNMSHNFGSAAVLQDFFTRNNSALPSFVVLPYSNSSQSWRTNYHYTGFADDGMNTEKWNIIFEWGCVSSVGAIELGQFVWKFSALFKRTLNGQTADARLLITLTIPTSCSPTDVLNFEFSIDTQRIAVQTGEVESLVLYDEIGLFKSRFWILNPTLLIDISELSATAPLARQSTASLFA